MRLSDSRSISNFSRRPSTRSATRFSSGSELMMSSRYEPFSFWKTARIF